MATSFIEYNSNGFWSNDSFTEISVEYLGEIITKDKSIEKWLDTYYKEKLVLVSKGYFPGFINIGFDTYLTSEEKVSKFISIIDEAITFVINKGTVITKEELNSFITNEKLQSKWSEDLSIIPIVETLKRFKMILQNQKPSEQEISI